jgi:hypothetical protein
VLDLPLIRRAYPSVPWIFLYREPLEVLMSQLRQRGSYFVPSIMPASRFGLAAASAIRMPAEEYCARVLQVICEAGLCYAAQYNGLLVEYRELPQAVPDAILDHFAVACTETEAAAMIEVATYDAKTPSLFYAPDSEAKRQAATTLATAAAERWMDPVYRQLNAARANQSSFGRPLPLDG